MRCVIKIITAIGDRPVWGHGLGAFHDMFGPYLKQEAAVAEWNYAHNSYLENAFEMGLPAAVLFYLSLGIIGLRMFYGVLTRRRGQRFPVFAMACFAAAAFHALFVGIVSAAHGVVINPGWQVRVV